MSTWRDKITFLTPSYEESEVNGKMLQFYPVSYRKLMGLRRIGQPLALAISSLFSNTQNDTGSVVRNFGGQGKDEIAGSEIDFSPRSRAQRKRAKWSARAGFFAVLKTPIEI